MKNKARNTINIALGGTALVAFVFAAAGLYPLTSFIEASFADMETLGLAGLALPIMAVATIHGFAFLVGVQCQGLRKQLG